MKTECKIDVVELNGEETSPHYPELTVTRHWNRYRNLVVLKYKTTEFTVTRDDLERAIKAVTLD